MHSYPAKLLLFGEHVLLTGATALAVPVPAFSGRWAWDARGEKIPAYLQGRLREFADSDALAELKDLDTGRFKADLERGLYFDSNIPTGYGMGSSGALCAAIYDIYMQRKADDPMTLKSQFSVMERFFHGSSSGIDPLTSYLGKPVLIRHQTEATAITLQAGSCMPEVFLYDTGQPRQTGPLVQWFLEQYEQPDFKEWLRLEYLPAHEAMIAAWIGGDGPGFWNTIRRISTFQLDHFIPMVPESMRDLWSASRQQPALALKICGAGGGGFLLGFSESKAAVETFFGASNIIWPFQTGI